MVVAESKTACDPGRNSAELGFDRHADSLGRGVAITNLGNVPPHSFGVPVVDDGKQPDLTIQHARDLRSVGAPHQVGRRGDDAAVMGGVLARQVAVWRQQAILPHQPQHPLAGNSNAVKHAQPCPDLAVSLANPGRSLEIGADGAQHRGIRDRRLGTSA